MYSAARCFAAAQADSSKMHIVSNSMGESSLPNETRQDTPDELDVGLTELTDKFNER